MVVNMIIDIVIHAFVVGVFIWDLILAAVLITPDRCWDNPKLKNTISTSFTYLKDIYDGRNLFGIVLSTIIVLISAPSFIFALIFSLFFEVCGLLVFVWNLGNKKEN